MEDNKVHGIKWSHGGIRKVRDIRLPCLSSEHYPPAHITLDPGEYEYTCPQCGEKTVFIVPLITF
jgi:hypothetical protein